MSGEGEEKDASGGRGDDPPGPPGNENSGRLTHPQGKQFAAPFGVVQEGPPAHPGRRRHIPPPSPLFALLPVLVGRVGLAGHGFDGDADDGGLGQDLGPEAFGGPPVVAQDDAQAFELGFVVFE